MKAYQKWKEKCVNHIEGDWAFFIYDFSNNQICMIKNFSGTSSCFYGKFNGEVYFSSDTKQILSVNKIAFCPRKESTQRVLNPIGYPINGMTLIKELFFVENGQSVFFRSDEVLKKNESRCNWENNSSYYKYDLDYELDFLNIYSSSVMSRIRGINNNGIFLSGGLDSSSIAALASINLTYQKKQITSFTSIPYFTNYFQNNEFSIFDESILVNRLKEKYGNINTSFHAFPNLSITEDLKLFSEGNAYYPIININSFWIGGILRESNKIGIKNVLTGQAGNYTITKSGSNYYVYLFLSLKFKRLFFEIRGQVNSETSFYLLLKYMLMIPLYFYIKRFFVSNLIPKRLAVSPRSLKSISIEQKKYIFNLKKCIPTFKKYLKGNLNNELSIQAQILSFTGNYWYIISSRLNTQVSDPTNDFRLVSFLNELPGRLFFSFLNRKYLFKRIMNKFLPEEIIGNSKRNIQSADFNYRLCTYLDLNDSQFCFNSSRNDDNILREEIKNLRSRLLDNDKKLLGNPAINHFLALTSTFYFCNKLKD
jgi:asparagine synthase (glutamine-hydrolysing)